MTLLKIYSQDNERSKNRFNVLGKPGHLGGTLEYELKIELTHEERAIAGEVFLELQTRGLLIPTYADLMSPGDWLVITDKGKQSLKSGALDDLDRYLTSLNSTFDLLGMRRGVYESMVSQNADWQRHAATSARELITKVLHTIAPDDLVRQDSVFQPNATSPRDITRKDRIKYYLRTKQGSISNRDVLIIEKASDLVEECYAKLATITHTDKKEVENLIKLTEDTLMYLLDR